MTRMAIRGELLDNGAPAVLIEGASGAHPSRRARDDAGPPRHAAWRWAGGALVAALAALLALELVCHPLSGGQQKQQEQGLLLKRRALQQQADESGSAGAQCPEGELGGRRTNRRQSGPARAPSKHLLWLQAVKSKVHLRDQYAQ